MSNRFELDPIAIILTSSSDTRARLLHTGSALWIIEILIQTGAIYWKDFNAPVVIFL
jgi:hypothetical protein